MAALRKRGATAQVVEQTIPHTFIKRDVFGFGDVLYVHGRRTVLAQVTTLAHLAARRAKIRKECLVKASAWLQAGNEIELWGWRRIKVKRRGKAVRWQAVIEAFVI